MYALLDFNDYKIEQRTKYSKAKVYIKKTESTVDLIDMKDKLEKCEYEKIKSFLKCNLYKEIFKFKKKLLNVVIPENTENIEDYAFNTCENLVSINIPDSVINIGEHAFYKCNELTTIKLPKNIKHIDSYAFSMCKKLKSIIIPNNVTDIDKYAFYGCYSLINIKLPDNIQHIKNYAFSRGNELASIEYNGIIYNNRNKLINALKENHVDVDEYAFYEEYY